MTVVMEENHNQSFFRENGDGGWPLTSWATRFLGGLGMAVGGIINLALGNPLQFMWLLFIPIGAWHMFKAYAMRRGGFDDLVPSEY